MTVPVSVEIIKNTLWFQDAKPFLICKIRPWQIPCDISGHDCIKTVTFHIKSLRIASFPHNTPCQSTGIALSFFQHFFSIVNSRHLITGFGKQNCKKSGACSDIENFDLLRLFFRKLISKQGKKLVPPHRSAGICHFLLIIF